MITGDEVRQARERRGWTQEQLASRLGVTQRSVGNWERGDVPAGKEARLREVLGDSLTPGGNPLAQASDLALISELARRLEARTGGQHHGVDSPAQKTDDPAQLPVTTRADTRLAARRASSRGKMEHDRAQERGEESQDEGDWDGV